MASSPSPPREYAELAALVADIPGLLFANGGTASLCPGEKAVVLDWTGPVPSAALVAITLWFDWTIAARVVAKARVVVPPTWTPFVVSFRSANDAATNEYEISPTLVESLSPLLARSASTCAAEARADDHLTVRGKELLATWTANPKWDPKGCAAASRTPSALHLDSPLGVLFQLGGTALEVSATLGRDGHRLCLDSVVGRVPEW